nr:hypothetical protein [uncultured Chryseobacterium sp.]
MTDFVIPPQFYTMDFFLTTLLYKEKKPGREEWKLIKSERMISLTW